MQKITRTLKVEKKRKKKMGLLLSAAVLLAWLSGCAHTSQEEKPSGIPYDDLTADRQIMEDQGETDEANIQNAAVLLDEKLEENLYVKAELTMPDRTLYEYAAQLKRFDYEKAREAIGQNAEGTVGGEEGTGSIFYQRNDLASHLDTYCSYAGERGMAEEKELSFLSKEGAVLKVQSLMEQLEVGGELGTPDVIAMNEADFAKVKTVILEDDSYQKILSSKGYGSDTFDENLEAYRMTFQVEENGIPFYRNEPPLRQTSERFLAHPAAIEVLLSNNGFEMITMTGMLEPYDGQRTEAAIIGEEGIKEALMKKYGDVILTSEYTAANIWMEYFPLLKEDSFTEVDLVPVWCIDFEIDGASVEESQYTIRLNAVTGEEIS